ncbi:MAG: dockerin type I domain-containing protein [Planctomycetota bacterium]
MVSFRSVAAAAASALLFAGSFAGETQAGNIDLVLDVEYTNASPDAGGSWQLFATTDEFGLFSLRVPLSGVGSAVSNELPLGRVNGSVFNNAGFSTFINRNLGATRELFLTQQVTPGGAGQQGLFYGVGTLSNGSPDFPAQQGGTNAIGPNITTLAGLQNAPWGTEDPTSSTGVTVASGQFSAGQMPAFGTSMEAFEAALFTGIGTISSPGATTVDVSFTTQVLTNLDAGLGGDFNGDGTVDLLDLDILGQNFGIGPGATKAQGDANGDGNVDLLDLDILGSTFGDSVGGAVSVPEPTTLTALLTALVFGAFRPTKP